MVYENTADFYCEICGKFIKTELVGSTRKDKQTKVVLSRCEACEDEFYRYNDLAIVYECAKILVSKSIIEKFEENRLKAYIRSHHLIFDSFLEGRNRKRESFDKILREFRENLRLLSRSTEEVSRIITRYNDISGALLPNDRPAKRFELFIHRKMKRSLTRMR